MNDENGKRLQSMPLGRPPKFAQSGMMPPFTAELKLIETVQKLAKLRGVSKAEILRDATRRGLRLMVAEHKAARNPEGVEDE